MWHTQHARWGAHCIAHCKRPRERPRATRAGDTAFLACPGKAPLATTLTAKSRACVQFSAIALSLAAGGSYQDSVAYRLPTNPRLAGGEFVGSAKRSKWAVTFVTSNLNLSTTAFQGPQYIFDNATLWEDLRGDFNTSRARIERAHRSVPPIRWCYDEATGSHNAECSSPSALTTYREPRLTPKRSRGGGGNAQEGEEDSSDSGPGTLAWVIPVVVAAVLIVALGAPATALLQSLHGPPARARRNVQLRCPVCSLLPAV